MPSNISEADARQMADFLDARTMIHRWLVAFFRNFSRFPREAAPFWSFWAMRGGEGHAAADLTGVVAHHFTTATTYVGFSPDLDTAGLEALLEEELLPERLVGDGEPMRRWESRAGTVFERASRREDIAVLELPPGALEAARIPRMGFRPARSADRTALRILERMYAAELGLEDPESDIDSIIEQGLAFVVEEEGEVAGTARSNLSDGRYVHVGGVYVLPRFRGRGIGGKVLAGLCDRVHSSGSSVILDVARENRPALRTYLSLGFREVADGVALRFPEDAWGPGG